MRLRPLIVSETVQLTGAHGERGAHDPDGGRAGAHVASMRAIAYRIELETKTGRFERNADLNER